MNFSYTQPAGPKGPGFYGLPGTPATTLEAIMAGLRTSTLRKGLSRELQPGQRVVFTNQRGQEQPAIVTGRRHVTPDMADELSTTERWTPDFLRWYMQRNGLEGGRMEQLLYQLPGPPQIKPGSRIYAGIGSRETPGPILDVMTRLASAMERDGWILRSGGAKGADAAFEAGTTDPARREIYLPQRYFNSRAAGRDGYIDSTALPAWQAALESVPQYHPRPNVLSPFAVNAMARNSMQVLGADLNTPARLVVAYAPGGYQNDGPPPDFLYSNGRGEGGTGQALRIARQRGIEIRNLANPATLERAMQYLSRFN